MESSVGQLARNTTPLLWTVERSTLPLLSRLADVERARAERDMDHGAPQEYAGFFPTLYCGANAMLGGMLRLLCELNDRFGGGEAMRPVRFSFFGRPAVLVTNPQHVHKVLKDPEHFGRAADPRILERWRALLGFNLVSADHETWTKVRPRTSAFLNGRPLAEYGAVMRDVMEKECLPFFEKSAATQTPFAVFDSVLELSSKVVFRSFMRLGAGDIPDEVHPTLNRLFGHVRQRVTLPSLPLWMPTSSNNEFKRDRALVRNFLLPYIERQKKLDTMMGSIIRAHTKRAPGRCPARVADYIVSVFPGGEGGRAEDLAPLSESLANVLQRQHDVPVYQLGRELAKVGNEWASASKRTSTLRQEQLEAGIESILCEGGEIDTELVLQEMMSNLIGGSETTILLMTWGLYFMSRVPEVQEKLHREAAANSAHKVPLIDVPTMKDQWPYLFNVLRETLRLASPSAIFNRPVLADVSLDGFEIKKGTLIWGSQYITHRSPHVWKEPERFMPERFEGSVPAGAWFPFSLGPRMCVGMNYAYLEAAIGLATIAKYFTFECLTRDVGYEFGLTFRPDRPVKILLKKR